MSPLETACLAMGSRIQVRVSGLLTPPPYPVSESRASPLNTTRAQNGRTSHHSRYLAIIPRASASILVIWHRSSRVATGEKRLPDNFCDTPHRSADRESDTDYGRVPPSGKFAAVRFDATCRRRGQQLAYD